MVIFISLVSSTKTDPVHIQARKKWDQRCKKTKGYCGLVIAKGSKGCGKRQSSTERYGGTVRGAGDLR